MTLKQLARDVWWWRRKGVRRCGPPGVDWPVVEIAARNYELMRRAVDLAKTRSYLDLTRDEKTFVHRLWCPSKKQALRFALPAQFCERGWSQVRENQVIQWNLRAPDKALIDAFLQQIRNERLVQRVRASSGIKGHKPRGVSWRYIEMLDRTINRHAAEHNPSERKSASDGRKMADTFWAEFRDALPVKGPRFQRLRFEINKTESMS